MKASEIVKDDVLRNQKGEVIYRVLWAEEPNRKGDVHIGVKYNDGGAGERVFDADQDVPLTHE